MVLSYRHAYHAGNFADVLKHSTLALLLQHFHKKPSPFYFLDTHAGGPLYHLRTDQRAQRTREHALGVDRIWHRRDYPAELEPYLSTLRSLNGIFPKPPLSAPVPALTDSSIGYVTGQPAPLARLSLSAPPKPPLFAWHHLLHSMGHSPTLGLPLFSRSLPPSAFDPSTLELYPGSTLIASYFQRQVSLRVPGATIQPSIADRMVACEMHPKEFEGLQRFYEDSKENDMLRLPYGTDAPALGSEEAQAMPPPRPHPLSLATRSRMHLVNASGWDGLVSSNNNVFLAPKQGRGLVLIDPPYESYDEAPTLLKSLSRAYRRFPHGMFAVWYPIVDYSPNSSQRLDPRLLRALLTQMNIPKMMAVEFDMKDAVAAAKTGLTPQAVAEKQARGEPLLISTVNPNSTDSAPAENPDGSSKFNSERQRGLGMTGTGLILINPPYQMDSQLETLCEYLAKTLPMPAQVEGHAEPQLYKAKWSVQWLTEERIPRKETKRASKETVASIIEAQKNTPKSTPEGA